MPCSNDLVGDDGRTDICRRPPDSRHNRRMADLPVACTLSPAALQGRRENLLNALLRRTEERRELPNGYSLRFAAESDVLSEIARAVDNERQCCRFLRFAVTVEPDDGPITVDLTGPPGTREFLAAMFDW
jgi:hypothetical protein